MMTHVLRQISIILQESRLVFEALVAIVVVLMRLDQMMLKRFMLDRRDATSKPHRYDSRDVNALRYYKRRETNAVKMLAGQTKRHVRSLVARLARRALGEQTKVR